MFIYLNITKNHKYIKLKLDKIMGDEQIKNSTFLESNNQLEDLKLQVLNIEHNYIQGRYGAIPYL